MTLLMNLGQQYVKEKVNIAFNIYSPDLRYDTRRINIRLKDVGITS